MAVEYFFLTESIFLNDMAIYADIEELPWLEVVMGPLLGTISA